MPTSKDNPGNQSSVQFRTTLHQAQGRSTTGIIVPDKIIEALGHGKRPPVRVLLNDFEYRTTIGAMGGKKMISVSAAIRKATGLAGGDPVAVTLTVDTTPREVAIPPDLAAAFDAQPDAHAFFGTLSNSLQRYHIDNINSAKAAETRQRRIDKAIALFADRKPR